MADTDEKSQKMKKVYGSYFYVFQVRRPKPT